MKNIGLALTILTMAMTSMAAPKRPVVTMDAVESTAHAIIAGLKKKQIDPLFGTDITGLTISSSKDGYAVEVIAPSADQNAPNKLSLTFDLAAKLTSVKQTVVSKNPNGALFTSLDAGTIMDYGAEAVVDHLLDTPTNPDLAPVSQTVVSEDLTLEANGPRVKVHLNDGRTYIIQMDKEGNVLTQGF